MENGNNTHSRSSQTTSGKQFSLHKIIIIGKKKRKRKKMSESAVNSGKMQAGNLKESVFYCVICRFYYMFCWNCKRSLIKTTPCAHKRRTSRKKNHPGQRKRESKRSQANDWLDPWQKYEQIVNTKFVVATLTYVYIYIEKRGFRFHGGYKMFILTWFHI